GEGIETTEVELAAFFGAAEIGAAFPAGLLVSDARYRSIQTSTFGWIAAGDNIVDLYADSVHSDPQQYLERDALEDITDWQVWSMDPERGFFTDETAVLITVVPEREAVPGRVLVTWREITSLKLDSRGLPGNWFQAQLTHRGGGDADIEFRYQICDWIVRRDDRPEDNGRSFLGFHIEGEGGQAWLSEFSFSPEMKLLCALSNEGSPENPARRGIWTYQLRDGRMSGCGLPGIDPPAGANRCNDGNSVAGDGCSVDCWVEADEDMDGQFEPPYEGALDPLEVYDNCLYDACIGEEDLDGDGIPNGMDNCFQDANPLQENYDGNNFGDACDENDTDADGIPQEFDSCPFYRNAVWRQDIEGRPDVMPDLDNDGIGDQCDDDDDSDEVLDCGADGICLPARDGIDNDSDTIVDEAGEIAINARWDGVDNDRDGFVDEASEADLQGAAVWPGPDNDGSEDNCRQVWNPEQGDLDFDNLGNACDPDVDGDGVSNCGVDGICPLDHDFIDNNRNGQVDEPGECAEPDSCPLERDGIDNDADGYVDEGPIFRVEPNIGILRIDVSAERHAERPEYPGPDEGEDNCPEIRNADQLDSDGNGIGDKCQDSDGDGRIDIWDNCPLVVNADQADFDQDQIQCCGRDPQAPGERVDQGREFFFGIGTDRGVGAP
ncbi:MAG TPA: hypothetical protein ENJ18_18790, partial [Nannocystis exedens]|nr:hypothetical protein [Nannocystis exedens]